MHHALNYKGHTTGSVPTSRFISLVIMVLHKPRGLSLENLFGPNARSEWVEEVNTHHLALHEWWGKPIEQVQGMA